MGNLVEPGFVREGVDRANGNRAGTRKPETVAI